MAAILISYIGYPVSGGLYLKKALKKLGHEVIHFGPDAGGFIPWKPQEDFSEFADKPDIALPYPFNDGIYPIDDAIALVGKKPDLVIQVDANFFLTGKAPCPNVVWAIDNHVKRYDETDFDIYFGAHSWAFGSDRENFTWLPCCYDPETHYQIENAQKAVDVAFVGVAYPNRIEIVKALSQVCIVGVALGLFGQAYNGAYNSARMGLCLSVAGDVPHRVFENAAQGLMIMCDRQRDLGKLGLIDGVHYVGISSPQEAIERHSFTKNVPGLRDRIAQAGKGALKDHTYGARARTILDRTLGIEKEPG